MTQSVLGGADALFPQLEKILQPKFSFLWLINLSGQVWLGREAIMRTVGGQLCIAVHWKMRSLCNGRIGFAPNMDPENFLTTWTSQAGTITRLARGSPNRYLGEFTHQSCQQYTHPFLRSARSLSSNLRSPNPIHI